MPWCSEILSSALGKEHFFNSLQTNQGCDAEILRTLGDYTAPSRNPSEAAFFRCLSIPKSEYDTKNPSHYSQQLMLDLSGFNHIFTICCDSSPRQSPWCDAFNLSETLDPAETSCCMMFVRSQNWYRGDGYIDLGVWPATTIGVQLTTIRNATRLATVVTHTSGLEYLGMGARSWNGEFPACFTSWLLVNAYVRNNLLVSP